MDITWRYEISSRQKPDHFKNLFSCPAWPRTRSPHLQRHIQAVVSIIWSHRWHLPAGIRSVQGYIPASQHHQQGQQAWIWEDRWAQKERFTYFQCAINVFCSNLQMKYCQGKKLTVSKTSFLAQHDLGRGLPIFKDTFKPLSASSELSADTFLPASEEYKDTFLPVSIISKDRKRGFERIDEIGKKGWKRMRKQDKIDHLSVSSVP